MDERSDTDDLGQHLYNCYKRGLHTDVTLRFTLHDGTQFSLQVYSCMHAGLHHAPRFIFTRSR